MITAFNQREEIVKKYIPLVKYIASRVIIGKTKYIEYEDLVSYGIVGLMDAINKFDEKKGMKFSTYASIRIKGSMIDQIRKDSPVPKSTMDKLNRYNDVVDKLQKLYVREPNKMEISNELGMTIDEVSSIENYINYISIISLEQLIFSKEDEIQLINSIKDENSPDPINTVEKEEEAEYLKKGIDMLNEKDKMVLSLYYYERFTLKQIGSVLGVSESRVCQLHGRAILNLRKNLKRLKYIKS